MFLVAYDNAHNSNMKIKKMYRQSESAGRIPPAFPPPKWNMHQVTLDDQPRTNNISEGWNNKFSSLVGE